MSVNAVFEIHQRLFYSPVLDCLVIPFFRFVSPRKHPFCFAAVTTTNGGGAAAKLKSVGSASNTHTKVRKPELFTANGS